MPRLYVFLALAWCCCLPLSAQYTPPAFHGPHPRPMIRKEQWPYDPYEGGHRISYGSRGGFAPQIDTSSYVPPHVRTFTSDRPKPVLVGITDGPRWLYYDYMAGNYILIGEQSWRNLTFEQAAEFQRTHPIYIPGCGMTAQDRGNEADQERTGANQTDAGCDSGNCTESVDAGQSAEPDDSETADEPAADDSRDASQAPAGQAPPFTGADANESSPSGWADYDGDGIIDEVFPAKSVVPDRRDQEHQRPLKPGDPVPVPGQAS